MRICAVLATLFALALVMSDMAVAQTRIRVLVDGQPITTYDIQQRAKVLRLVGEDRDNSAAEQELIDEILQFLEARRLGIAVSDSQVDAAFASIAQRNGISLKQLDQAMNARGVSSKAFKRRMKGQMLWREVVRQKSGRTGALSEQDVIAALREKGDEVDQTTVELTMTQVMLVIPGNGSNSNINTRIRQANNLRKRFKSCSEGLLMARDVGEVVIKPLGVRTSADMTGPNAEDILATPVGQLSKPIRGRNSIDMYAVCDRREIRSTAAAQAKLQLEMEQDVTEMELRRFARDLRKNAIIEYR